MSTRAAQLAQRIQDAAAELSAFAETCSEDEWQIVCEIEQWSVGTVVHHVASAYPTGKLAVHRLLEGNGITGFTWQMIDANNAQHAQDFPNPDKSETLALLKSNSNDVANFVSTLTDTQLDIAGPISLNYNAMLTVQYFLEDHPVQHPLEHLTSIRATLGR